MGSKVVEVVVLPDGRLDAKNAASYLGFATKTLAQMRCDGTGPAYLKAGRVFYYLDDLNAWIASAGKRRSTAQRAAT